MRKLQKISAALLAWLLVISLALPAYAADWTTYQNDNNHNGVITDSAPITGAVSKQTLGLTDNGSGWDGIDTAPVMQTLSGGDTYAYIIYDGYAINGNKGGGRLAKINANSATEVWSKQLSLSAGFQLSTPLLVQGNDASSEADDAVYVGTTGYSQILKNDELNGTSLSDWTVSGGSAEGDHIAITGNVTASLMQSGLTMNTTATNRATMGIWVGNSANPGIALDVTVKVDGVAKVTKSFPASTTALEDSSNPGNYYYYVNENFTATNGSDVEFIVDVKSGNSGTVKVDYASLYQQTGSIQKVTDLHLATPNNVSVVTGISGQINTPITTDGTYLYFGTWPGGSNKGTYYQVKLSDYSVKTFTPDAYGFYWAGATVVGDYVYFGSDNGKLYYRSVSDFDGIGVGGVVDLSTDGDVTAGNVRSSIAVHDNILYFTSQGGHLWSYTLDSLGVPVHQWNLDLLGTSTSTPVITDNGRIYVGYYSGFTVGGIQVIDINSGDVSNIATPGPVQSSVIAYTLGTTDYVYFTTNSSNGAGYGYSYDGITASQVWDTTGMSGKTYTLQGMAASNGYLVFGNDYNNVYIVH